MQVNYEIAKKKKSSDILDTLIKVGTLLVSVATLSISLWNYNRDFKRDYARKLYEEKQKVLVEYINACANIAAVSKDSVSTTTFKDYYRAYEKIRYGTFSLIADSTLLTSDIDFFLAASAYRDKSSAVYPQSLQVLVRKITSQAKENLKKTWYETE